MSKTVLVVDDSAMIRMQVKRALNGAGFTTIEAVDGQDAFEKMGDGIDLVVCDVNMPRMSGIEFLERVRDEGDPDVPVLMLTTEAQPELIRQARDMGAKGWIVKPFKPHLLIAAVTKMAA